MAGVVIVGYGMAGARLAAELCRRRPDRTVTVLGAEPHRAYNRILLSHVLAGRLTAAQIALPEPTGPGLDLRLGCPVAAIDPVAHTVTLPAGERLPYRQLVLATGGRPWIPPVAGLTDPLPERVAVFRGIDDCHRILCAARGARRAIVLGGGLLGVEAARGLALRGLSVEVVHTAGHLMQRQLDAPAGTVLATCLAGLGVTTHPGASTVAVDAGPGGVDVVLRDGRHLRADLLVVACGVRADVTLAARAGLAVDRGVVVDDQLRTSAPDVFAIGDCAQHDGTVGGLVAPAWEQARVVAEVLTGAGPGTRYRPTPPVTRLKAAGIDLVALGDSTAVGDATAVGDVSTVDGGELVVFSDPARGTYAKLVLRRGRVAGAIMLGDNPAVGRVIQLFDRGTPVPADRRALLLGRMVGGPATDGPDLASPALMPDGATVCRCNSVRKGDLVRAWRAGADSVDGLATATRATTGCGSCGDAVRGIADWLRAASGQPADAQGQAGRVAA